MPFYGQAAFAAERSFMEFFNSAIGVLQTLVIALGAGLGIWGVINLLEGYGNDNPGAKSQGIKPFCSDYEKRPPYSFPRNRIRNGNCLPIFSGGLTCLPLK